MRRPRRCQLAVPARVVGARIAPARRARGRLHDAGCKTVGGGPRRRDVAVLL